ncbi:RNA-guided endonuclease InsQ/TnpB family protein [Ktedonobacter racemifer]|uniref:Transposase, IS605 OrfB family n=1 Tax=Ktedonobacter racemifer DSM 44963 TaxID=485913 RepID=D6TBT0_KTERA|nr:RNA-guided endonuclease TnpB family protein [Ktedonobacter racemifer]EFH89862.1 transposase, IS605 OrfB family [Ktedonobacter racemifer DSM 44963]
MLLCKKIKIDVSEQDAATLEFMQSKCRGLYNWWVMRLREGEKWDLYEAKRSLQESKQHDPELVQVYGKLLQEVYYRLHGAMKAFYRRVKAGETPGFPRVRPRHCFFTLCYPAMYLKIEGDTLILPTGGGGKHGAKVYPNIVARLTEAPPEGFREVAISRDGRGNYSASFVRERNEKRHETEGTVAFDLGIKTLATGVNEQGRVYTIGGFKGARWHNKQLDKIRSKRDKCKKKSRRYIHLSKVYKRVSQKKRNKQQDSLHKASHLIAHKLVERTVVVGDLSQRQMVTKEHRERNKYLNRAVFNEWGLYTFIQMLTYKSQLYGKDLHFLDEHNTSKQCSGCGNLQAMPLWKRTYCCVECGLVMDRDENSAHNILTRFFARQEPHTQARPECGVLHATQSGVEVKGASCKGQVQQLNLFEGV